MRDEKSTGGEAFSDEDSDLDLQIEELEPRIALDVPESNVCQSTASLSTYVSENGCGRG